MTKLDDLFPRNYNIEKKFQKEYNNLKEKSQLFEDKENTDIFLFAMALGVKNKEKKKLVAPYPVINCTGFDSKARALITSVAISEKGIEVISDRNEIRRIAEEYANAGFAELDRIVKGKSTRKVVTELEEEIVGKLKV
jgi:hypothetical protein